MSRTILYVEDNDDNIQLIKAIGEEAGYTVLTTYDGKEGLDMALSQIPDLIILDYHLPTLNGLDIVRILRGDHSVRHIPIMMLTADLYSYPESIELGVNDYLNKPIRRDMLLNRIDRLLNPDSNT